MMKIEARAMITSLRRSLRVFLLGSALFLAGFLASLVITADATPPESRAVPADQDGVVPERGVIHSTFADVAEQVRPAVVYIKTERSLQARERSERFGPFDFFREMFPESDRPRRIPGGGSGFIIDKSGRIVTNHHVIRDAETITVVMGEEPYEEEYEATVVGYDAYSDIAVIEIDADRDLPVVQLGDSDEMRVGDWVMAIGTPFGQLSGTVTVGVISAKGRTDLRILGGNADSYQNFIQTDASINFGNSGGPLVNLRGEAIGINTAINPSGQGIGFAIPVNMAKNISRQLIEKGRVQYGFMGIRLQELNKTLAQGLDLDIENGILVTDVLPDTPAEKAGIMRNDVIVEFDKKPVRDDQRFRLMVGNTEVGTEVPIVVVRKGQKKNLRITLGERPADDVLAITPPSPEGWLGLQVDDYDDGGVVVVRVEEGSPADEAGIREGDVITEVYSRKVANLRDYVEISETLKERKDPIAFLVKRDRTSRYVPVIPEKE
ncbi:MAG: trypsin-like peptidase domain-containing protein [Candidatus Latescibacterota bacterium]|nr:MAG: trypsin-like peptidase domain-containing protein [Candidatus Latescibacterota bacterium]